jgi:precorrin-4 methylase
MQALVERSDAEIETLQRALHLARRRRERAADVMRIHNGDTNLRGATYARS